MLAGLKTDEGRPTVGWVAVCKPNDAVRFKITDNGPTLCVRITRVKHFEKGPNAWLELVRYCGVRALMPHLHPDDIEYAAAIYRTFATTKGKYDELEQSHGVSAIGIEIV